MKNKRWCGYGGFTLVELLVVITIIAMLSGLVLAGVMTSRRKALQLQCMNNLRQLSLFITRYAADTGMYPDSARWTGTASLEDGPLARYTKDPRIYACPADSDLKTALKKGMSVRRTSYACNSWFDRKSFSTQVALSEAVFFMEPFITAGGAMETSFQPAGAPRLTDRHSGGGLLAYGDGHVEFFTQDRFEKNKQGIFEATH